MRWILRIYFTQGNCDVVQSWVLYFGAIYKLYYTKLQTLMFVIRVKESYISNKPPLLGEHAF